jgi:hypothetical protein
MDDQRFDTLTRALAAGITRRGALGILAGLAALKAGNTAAKKRHRKGGKSQIAAQKNDHKVTICHLTSSKKNPVVQIEVDESAIPAHKAHGDTIDPDFQNDPANCGGCGISCDDGKLCTIDTCVKGKCVNTPIDCNDRNPCTDDSCDETTGDCVNTPVPGRACDDGNACTENDRCNRAGECVGTEVNCDDGNACTTDTCDRATGCVHTAINCDDGDPCTNDSCDPDSGCVNEPVICPVGQACLNGECVGCAGGTCANLPLGCDDDPVCICFITTEQVGFCHRSELCAGLQTCTTSADCPADHPACSTATCCGNVHVCIRPCQGTQGLRARDVSGPTTGGE